MGPFRKGHSEAQWEASQKAKDSQSKRAQRSSAARDPTKAGARLVKKRHDDDQENRQSRRQQPVDLQVNRCLQDNFAGFSSLETDGFKINGRTLREKLSNDKLLARDNPQCGIKFGKKYFNDMRTQYGQREHVNAGLVVADESLPINHSLVEAITNARTAAPQKMIEFCQTEPLGNQSEIAGLLRFGLELKPWMGGQQRAMSVEIMKHIVRTGMIAVFPNEVAAYRPQIDKTLSQVYIAMKGTVEPDAFWKLYRPYAALVLSVDAVDRLLAAKSTWDGHDDDLDAITSSGDLGMKMFGFAMMANAGIRLGKKIDEQIASSLDVPLVTSAVLQKARDAITNEVLLKMPHLTFALNNKKRAILVKYRGQDLPVEVSSVYAEVNVRLMATMKSRAIAMETSPSLIPLFNEVALLPLGGKSKLAVEESLLLEMNVARSSANALLTAERMMQGSAVDDVLTSRSEAILQIDPTFGLEISFFRWLIGAGGQQLLQARVLDALPSSQGFHSAKSVAVTIEQIKASPLYAFVSREGQSSVNIAGEFVTSLANLRMPVLKAAEGHDFLLKVKDRLQWFLSSNAASSSTGPGVHGLAALTAMFEIQQQKATDKQEVKLEDLQMFHAFHWLLTPAQVTVLQTMVSGIYKGLKHPPSAAAKAPAKRKQPEGSDAQAKKVAATAATMLLFTNKK